MTTQTAKKPQAPAEPTFQEPQADMRPTRIAIDWLKLGSDKLAANLEALAKVNRPRALSVAKAAGVKLAPSQAGRPKTAPVAIGTEIVRPVSQTPDRDGAPAYQAVKVPLPISVFGVRKEATIAYVSDKRIIIDFA